MTANDASRDIERFDAYRAALREAVTAKSKNAVPARTRKVRLLTRHTATPAKRRSAA